VFALFIRLSCLMACLLLLAPASHAGPYEDSVAAYDKGDYATAFQKWLPLGEKGDADAQNRLGILYQNAQGVPQDDTQAASWYQKAADQGNSNAQFNLAILYETGKGVAQDYVKALALYRQAAAQGDSDAINAIGIYYEKGYAVPQDAAKAAQWYRKAAALGNSFAQNNLGVLLENGNGVNEDLAQAAEWYRKAAALGNADAQNNLGILYENGRGVSKDPAQAALWYQKAADQGDADAQNNLGVLYQNGLGVPLDYAQAMKWYRKAAEQNNKYGLRNIGYLYAMGNGVPQDYAEAVTWYQKALSIDPAYSDALISLGWLYDIGAGVPLDREKARAFYQAAAGQNDGFGLFNLAELYHFGDVVVEDDAKSAELYKEASAQGIDLNEIRKRSVEEIRACAEQGQPGCQYWQGLFNYDGYFGLLKADKTEAARWFRRAADQGHPYAQARLARMLENGDGVAKDADEAVEYYRLAAAANASGNGWVAVRLALLQQTLSAGGTPAPGPAASPPRPLGKRVALVIGNGNYANTVKLPNPPHDAAAIAGTLKALGFTVVLGTDLDKPGFERAIRDFAEDLPDADDALFFYAGHGLQVNGENYLVPVDAKVEDALSLKFELIRVDDVLQYMTSEAKVTIALLDACRDNPLSRSLSGKGNATRSLNMGRGMAPIDIQGAGALIGYATAPGDTAADGDGDHSPFTTALLKYLPQKNLEVEQMMKRVKAEVIKDTNGVQRPWHNSDLSDDVYLAQ